jgi:hypothetical protein
MLHTKVDIMVSPSGEWIEVEANGKSVFAGSNITPADLQHILNKFVPDAKLHLNYDFDNVEDEE